MKILLMGGPRFLGYALIESALERGHELTLFNRGKTSPESFPEVERIIGDRDGGLAPLEGRHWDAVIDTCGYFPRLVGDSARLLSNSVSHYTFVSSISVYSEPIVEPFDETLPVAEIEDPSVEEITGETYGALKALCEQAAEAAMPGRVLQVRPGLIVGPRDPSGRFTYWPLRTARGGRILAPGSPTDPAQVIDVRDLAQWMIRMIEGGKTGIYNASSREMPFGDMLSSCLEATGKKGYFDWVPTGFLLELEAAPWVDIPLWLTGESKNSMKISVEKAIDAGLLFRPMQETSLDTLQWAKANNAGNEWETAISAEREAELFREWDLRAKA